MRTILLVMIAGLVAALLAGCSGISATQPHVALPVNLPDIPLFGIGGADPLFLRTPLDVSNVEEWQQYSGHIEAFEGVSLTMLATNETGSTTNPQAVTLHLYVSDQSNLTLNTIGQAEHLLDIELPAGQRVVNFDSGRQALSAAAGEILRDGKCSIYIVGTPSNLRVTMQDVQMRVHVRVSVI